MARQPKLDARGEPPWDRAVDGSSKANGVQEAMLSPEVGRVLEEFYRFNTETARATSPPGSPGRDGGSKQGHRRPAQRPPPVPPLPVPDLQRAALVVLPMARPSLRRRSARRAVLIGDLEHLR
jgi:hypothetical protein